MSINSNKIFSSSIFVGILIWIISFTLIPVVVVEPIHSTTIFFILANYISLCLGFYIFKFKDITNFSSVNNKQMLNVLIGIIVISFLLRYFDLFFVRDLSFSNEIAKNRSLNEQNFKLTRVLLILASILKSLNFFPAVIIFSSKKEAYNIWYKLIGVVLLVLPLVEALLKATRKPLLEMFLVLLITLIVYKRYTITKRKVLILGVVLIGLVGVSNSMLFERESQKFKNENIYHLILDAKYNEFLQPNEGVKELLLNPETNSVKKQIVFNVLHIGQYITHGVFEFNHLINSNIKERLNGAYIFSTLPKFLNIELESRPSVYLTFFGALYLDFRWFSIIIMFLFGIIQRYIFCKAINLAFYKPLVVYLIITNLLLSIFCFVRGAGIYPFVGFLIIILLYKIYEKSFST